MLLCLNSSRCSVISVYNVVCMMKRVFMVVCFFCLCCF